MRNGGFAAAVALAAALATPALAEARPTLTFDKTCAGESDITMFSGTGYTPGGDVAMFAVGNGRLWDFTVKADASGAISGGVRVPSIEDFKGDEDRPMELSWTANDQTRLNQDGPSADAFGVSQFTIAPFFGVVPAWNASMAIGRPGRRSTLRASGFTGGRVLYAHYRRGGRTVKSVRVGALGACGTLTAQFREFAFRPVKAGTYRVVLTANSTYDADDGMVFYRRVVVRKNDAVR